MRLVKYGHACVRLEKDDTALVIDPGVFSEPEALEGASAVLVTHEHADHIDQDALRAAAARDPRLRVWTNGDVAAGLADLGERVTAVSPGDGFDAAGFDVRVFGGFHALNHPDLKVVANVAFLVDGQVFHPGDSFHLPAVPIDTLLVPTHAPWSKTAEVVDYVRAVRPRLAFSIHDALLNDLGLGLVDGHVQRVAEPFGVTYRRLAPGESTTL